MSQQETKGCQVENCGRPIKARQYCSAHHCKFLKYGDPTVRVKGVYVEEQQRVKFWSSAILTSNPDKCWEWQLSKSPKGYGVTRYMGKAWRTHRLAFFLANGYEPRPMALHNCDNPGCVNPNHLRQGTAKENTQDMMKRGRHDGGYGEHHGQSKLTERQVLMARALRAGGATYRAISSVIGLSESGVKSVVTGLTWKHI